MRLDLYKRPKETVLKPKQDKRTVDFARIEKLQKWALIQKRLIPTLRPEEKAKLKKHVTFNISKIRNHGAGEKGKQTDSQNETVRIYTDLLVFIISKEAKNA